MLSRLFGHRSRDPQPGRGERPGGAVLAPAVARPGGPDVELPPAAEMLDAWRQEVARGAIALHGRYPLADAERGHAERLLVRLAIDVEFVIRQPSQAAQEAFAVAADP